MRYSLRRQVKMTAAGVISGNVNIRVAKSDDWKPLCEFIKVPEKVATQPSPIGVGPTSSEPAAVISFSNRYVSRWPNAFIIGGVIFLFAFWLYAWSANHLRPGGFDWHLYLANAVVEMGILAILLLGIKALRDARKRSPVKSVLPKFCVSFLLVLLFLMALPCAFFVVNLYSAYNAYTAKQAFVEVAPEQFRVSACSRAHPDRS